MPTLPYNPEIDLASEHAAHKSRRAARRNMQYRDKTRRDYRILAILHHADNDSPVTVGVANDGTLIAID